MSKRWDDKVRDAVKEGEGKDDYGEESEVRSQKSAWARAGVFLGMGNMKRFHFWVTWLKGVSIVFGIFGLALALFNQTSFFNVLFNDHINPVFFEANTLSEEFFHFQQWIYGVLGATCVLVSLLVFFIIENSLKKRERWGWTAILIGIVAWFIIDESISLYFSVYFNACVNMGLLIAFGLPLLFIARCYRDQA